jgi:glycerol kinase
VTEKYFLSLDQGGHSSRALIFDDMGNLVTRAQVAVEVESPQPDHVEQSPSALVSSLARAASLAIKQLPAAQRIFLQSASIVCQRSSVAFWHAEDAEPFANVISWQDRRGAKLLADVVSLQITADDLKQRTGLVANPHYGASKIAWMLRHNDAVRAAAANNTLRCGPLAAYLIRALTNNSSDMVDAGNASRTQLMSLSGMDWDESVLAAFGIPLQALPRVQASLSDYGMLTLDDVSLPLRYVNGDQNAALFANGVIDPHAYYVSIGTGAFCLAPWNSGHLPSSQQLLTLIALLQSPFFAIEGTVNAAASAIDWLESQHGRSRNHDDVEQWLTEETSPPIFINTINGLGSPFWRGDIDTRFISGRDGEDQDGSYAQCFVAVIESIVFALVYNMDLMRQSGTMAKKVFVAGGLGQYDGLCQKLADLAQLPVTRHHDAEASARGAAFWLAGCPKHWACDMPKSVFTPKDNATLRQRYERWYKEVQTLCNA